MTAWEGEINDCPKSGKLRQLQHPIEFGGSLQHLPWVMRVNSERRAMNPIWTLKEKEINQGRKGRVAREEGNERNGRKGSRDDLA